jgi:hypothetical protein
MSTIITRAVKPNCDHLRRAHRRRDGPAMAGSD